MILSWDPRWWQVQQRMDHYIWAYRPVEGCSKFEQVAQLVVAVDCLKWNRRNWISIPVCKQLVADKFVVGRLALDIAAVDVEVEEVDSTIERVVGWIGVWTKVALLVELVESICHLCSKPKDLLGIVHRLPRWAPEDELGNCCCWVLEEQRWFRYPVVRNLVYLLRIQFLLIYQHHRHSHTCHKLPQLDIWIQFCTCHRQLRNRNCRIRLRCACWFVLKLEPGLSIAEQSPTKPDRNKKSEKEIK